MSVQKSHLHISYNAPVTLTFILLAVCVFLLDLLVVKDNRLCLFLACKGNQQSAMPFDIKVPFDYVRLFTHVFAHADWNHLLANLPLILVLGPVLEERYGGMSLAIMMLITAFVTGVINASLLDSAVYGASGIVYMMILLCAFVTPSRKEIPLSFLLVLALYLGKEFFAFNQVGIATIAHIAGGLCGSLFAFTAKSNK